jgi:flagellin
MGLRIQNNIEAMNAHRNLTQTSASMSKSLERLSSGYRVNKAADDAAGLSISQAMRADIASYKVASRNVSEANAMVQVAEGAYDQIGNMLTRLKELATQASSANAASNTGKIDSEAGQLLNEIDRIAISTEYAGAKLLNGSFGVTASSGSDITASTGLDAVNGLIGGQTYTVDATGAQTNLSISITATIGGSAVTQVVTGVNALTDDTVSFKSLGLTLNINGNFDSASDGDILANAGTASNFQVGAKKSVDDQIGVSFESVSTLELFSGNTVSLIDASNASDALDFIDAAIAKLNDKRGALGAIQNRLGYASANLSTTIENVQAAESVIRDVDMAAEMTSFTKSQILMQAGTAMLAQANMAPQGILSLIG